MTVQPLRTWHADACCSCRLPRAPSVARPLIITRGHRHANAPQAYKRAHGDCNVPQRWATDQRLGNWVNEQRNYKKALDRGEPKPIITAARVAKLDGLGFAWEMTAAAISKQISKGNRDDAGWAAQLAKLKAYKRKHGDYNVPNHWAEDPGLGRWVRVQRVSKKVLELGKPQPRTTAARVRRHPGYCGAMFSASKLLRCNVDHALMINCIKFCVINCSDHNDCVWSVIGHSQQSACARF
jgi:hypothetical protein